MLTSSPVLLLRLLFQGNEKWTDVECKEHDQGVS